MTEPKENPILVSVATTIADGFPVDWDNLIAEYPEVADDLQALRVLQKVPEVRQQSGGAKETAREHRGKV